jgi:ABC-type glutathione transport system ATPase component
MELNFPDPFFQNKMYLTPFLVTIFRAYGNTRALFKPEQTGKIKHSRQKGAEHLISNLSVHFPRGFTGVIGANGVGKTTLLQLMKSVILSLSFDWGNTYASGSSLLISASRSSRVGGTQPRSMRLPKAALLPCIAVSNRSMNSFDFLM